MSNFSGTAQPTRQAILAHAARVADAFHPHRIVLFGSHAYGHPTADSDVDLLVEMPHAGKPWQTASAIRAAVHAGYAVDYLVRSSEELADRIAMGDGFIREIVEKGEVLYAAPDATREPDRGGAR